MAFGARPGTDSAHMGCGLFPVRHMGFPYLATFLGPKPLERCTAIRIKAARKLAPWARKKSPDFYKQGRCDSTAAAYNRCKVAS